MLERLILSDFQCYQKFIIDFEGSGCREQVTSIVGPSDSGKSAIIRALKWLALNDVAGLGDYLRWDAKTIKAILCVDDHKITRRKGKQLNLYRLDDQQFEAFGRSVPEDIEQALQVSEDNFQDQFDGPFWLSLSPGQAAQALNEIVDLSIIDESLADVASQLRKETARQQVIQENLTKAEKQVEELEYVDQLDEDLSELEEINQELGKFAADERAIRNLIRQSHEAVELQENARTLLQLAHKARTEGERLKELTDELNGLDRLLAEIDSTQQWHRQTKKYKSKKETELHELTDGRCPVCGKEMENVA